MWENKSMRCPTQKFELVNVKGFVYNVNFVYTCSFVMILLEKVL